jgi:predicted phosphodiesterase
MPILNRRRATLLAAAVAGAAAALALLGVLSPTHGRLGPGTVEVRARTGSGRTEVSLPPLGVISARTHRAPVVLSARVDRLDVSDLQELLRSGSVRERIERRVSDDAAPLLRLFAIRTLIAATMAGALAGALLPHRRPAFLAAGAVGGAVAVTAVLGIAWRGYDTDAFREPRFRGPIERAPAVLNAARRIEGRVEALADRVAELYEATTRPGEGDESAVRILHVSDVHSNPLGVELAERLVRGLRIDAVLDTGDLTSFGLPIESRIGDLIGGMRVPYYFVPGNHDSPDNRAAMAAIRNVHVLDGTVADVDGVRILGVADPTFTATNQITADEARAEKLIAAPEVAVLATETPHDVLAVHDPALGVLADGVVVAGHVHRRTMQRRGDTLVLTVGSTGATGLGSFAVQSDLPYEAEVLNFAGNRLVAIDYVTVQGLSGEFRVERTLLE